VLLDEPFSALDASLRIETRQAVAAVLEAAGATALLVTHDQSEALSMGREVAVLRDGVLAQVAPPEVLYREPVDGALAQFVGEAALMSGVVASGFADCALGRLELARPAPDGPAEVMIRPEQIRIEPDGAPDGAPARVLAVTYYGHDASVSLALEAGGEPVTARVAGHLARREGVRVSLKVDGPAMAYPRAAPPAREPSAAKRAGAASQATPLVPIIKERLA
jgi:iron(III) transport system ATP-binding protein